MMPSFTMSASMGMLILMMTVMLPPLLEAFQSRGADVPLITRIAILMVDALHGNMLIIGGVILFTGVDYYVLRRIQTAHEWLHGAQVKLPIMGSLIVAKELAQFSRTNAMLLQAGVPLARALPLGIAGCKNLVVRKAMVAGEDSLLAGHGFAEALARHPVLPRLRVEMVMIGEENNVIDQTLGSLAETYEKEVDNRLGAILALAEPMSTFAVGGVVLFMALSMFLPIYSGLEVVK